MAKRMDVFIMRAFNERQTEPPFIQNQVQPFEEFVDEFLMAHGIQPDWSYVCISSRNYAVACKTRIQLCFPT